MSLFKGRKASKKKKSEIKAAEEEWDEIEENEESEEEETARGEEEILAAAETSKRNTGSEADFDDEDDEEDEDEEDEDEEDEDEEDEDEEDEDEENEDEEDEDDEKPHRKKKSKRFPVFGLIFMFLLIGIILGAGYYGMVYYERFHAMNDQFDAARDAASAELVEAQKEYALADPDSPANVAVRDELKDVLLADIREQVAQMESEKNELDASIREREEKLKEIEGVEDFDYYKAIYDEYVEGREYVEELLSDH